MKDTTEFLLELGFNLHRSGFVYWKEAINLIKNKNIFVLKDIFKILADKFNVSESAVSASMRREFLNNKDYIITKYDLPINTTMQGIINFIKYMN